AAGGEGGVGAGHGQGADAPVEAPEENGALGLGRPVGDAGVSRRPPHPVDADASSGAAVPGVVDGPIAVALDPLVRGPVEGAAGIDAGPQGGEVDERLERRTGLAGPETGFVELGGVEVEPTEEA